MIKRNLNKILLKSIKIKSLILGKSFNFRIVFTFVLFITLFNNHKLSANIYNSKDNIEIIDSLLQNLTKNSLENLNKQNINLQSLNTKTNLEIFNDNFELAVLNNIEIIKDTKEQKISINSKQKETNNNQEISNLSLNINNFEINYNSIDNSDKFQREILLDFVIKYTDSNNNKILLKDKYTYQDTISESEISKVENTNFPISIGKKNKEESTFLDDILEPIIITGTIAVTVILLFTIRSN
ncbi:MAG: hypothetical protein ACOVNU_12005 [Candidatus Kapaibacteriota bacterium]